MLCAPIITQLLIADVSARFVASDRKRNVNVLRETNTAAFRLNADL